MLDGVGPLFIFFRKGDDFRNKINIRFPVKEIVWADSELDVIVTAIEKTDSEETDIGVSHDILGAEPAGGLALQDVPVARHKTCRLHAGRRAGPVRSFPLKRAAPRSCRGG